MTHIIVEALINRTDLLQELNVAKTEDWGAATLGGRMRSGDRCCQ